MTIINLLSLCVLIIDRTPPQLRVTSALPSRYSNETQWRFTFECVDLTPCTTECSIHRAGTAPSFQRCQREWSASGFGNRETLEFSLRGYDDAGNVASPMVHQWTIGNDVNVNSSIPLIERFVNDLSP